MKPSKLIVALFMMSAVSAQAADAAAQKAATPEAAKPVAVVNGVALPDAYASMMRQQLTAQGVPANAVKPEEIRDQLIAMELLAQEAQKKGLDKSPEVSMVLELQRKNTLKDAALVEFLRGNPVSEDAMKQEYARLKSMPPPTEYRVRHILVGSEKDAKDIIAKLANSKNKFEDLAKQASKDTGSKTKGGDLGWTSPNALGRPLGLAVLSLKKGEYSKTPVQTQYGWHVVRVDDTREDKLPTYDEVKPRIAQKLQQEKITKYLQELRAKAKID